MSAYEYFIIFLVMILGVVCADGLEKVLKFK